jgi:hypothetical protein
MSMLLAQELSRAKKLAVGIFTLDFKPDGDDGQVPGKFWDKEGAVEPLLGVSCTKRASCPWAAGEGFINL